MKSIISAIVLASAAVQAAELTATPMTLEMFDQNFHANSFCKIISENQELAQPDSAMDLFTGKVFFPSEEEQLAELERRALSPQNGREIRFDAARTKDTCVGENFEWHEFITDEIEWQKLVQKELTRVVQVPTELHLWVATIWSHVTVDEKYSAALAEKFGLPHHHDEDDEGNFVTPFLHSAFGQYSSTNDDFGPVDNPGYFVLPLDASMAQLAQDEKLFEHLFPLPAMFKVHPSVRVFVDHAGQDPDVGTCGGEDLDIFLTAVASKVDVHATEVAEEWNEKLEQEHKDAGMKFFSIAPHVVTLEREDRGMHLPIHMDQVVEWLAQDHRVADIELRPHFYPSNGYGASVTQVEVPPMIPVGQTAQGQPVYGLADLKMPVFEQNIKGQGQVVGVGDSGLDYDACFFSDATQPITQAQIPSGRTGQPANFPNHRKIVQYRGYADNLSGEIGGHGSHVAGSVAGKVVGNLGEQTAPAGGYDGAAPEAKVAFFDIGRPGQRGLDVPPSLATNFFPPSRQVGAFIHTNSWGSTVNGYSSTARDCDIYQHENPDYLVLVAAGNSGRNGAATVGTPATAKNVIGVGASVAPKNSFADQAIGICVPATGPQAKCGGTTRTENSMADFSSSGPTFDGRQQPVISAPGQEIISSRSGANPGIKTCDLTPKQGTSMATPLVAGDTALVRQYFTEGFYPTGTKSTVNAQKPTGALLKALIVNGARVVNNQENLGQPLKRGATPVAPGTKGLPDTVQGHGVVTLTHSMMFQNAADGFSMHVLAGFCPSAGGVAGGVVPRNSVLVDGNSCSRQDVLNMEHVTNGVAKPYPPVQIKPNPQLGVNVTLAWSDAPGTLGNRGPALVNNLDLVVTDNLGKTYLPTKPSTGTRQVEDRDTVEKVIINPAELVGVTSITVTVTGKTVPQGPQPFALVVGGAVASPVPPIPEDPPGAVVIDVIEGIGVGQPAPPPPAQPVQPGQPQPPVQVQPGPIADSNLIVENNFSKKNPSTFGLIVFANVGGLVLALILLIVLQVVGCWCCLTETCALTVAIILRVAALVGTIIAFVYLAIEQSNIEEIIPTAKFGSNWQQILVLVALSMSVLECIIGGLIGIVQVTQEPTVCLNTLLLIGDSLVALALAAASIAAANVGNTRYFFLRQSIVCAITEGVYLIILLIDAAHAFNGDDDEDAAPQSTYKPSYNKTSYKPSSKPSSNVEPVKSSMAPSRRQAPAPPKEPMRVRPKSTRGEILVALYDYQGQEADELDFEEGARIELIEDHADGWASGIVMSTRAEGLFPLNYTEKE